MARSKIVSRTRFDKETPFIDENKSKFRHKIVETKKISKRSVESKAHTRTWLLKSPSKEKKISQKEKIIKENLNAQIEVFSAWCYEAFLNNPDQPKYYLIDNENSIFTVASQKSNGFKSLRALADKTGVSQKLDLHNLLRLTEFDNLSRLAKMLVMFLWLAGSDFKIDHIGINQSGKLLCLDFDHSLISFMYMSSTSHNLNFDLDYKDLENAPFFTKYKSNNYFLKYETKTAEKKKGSPKFIFNQDNNFKFLFAKALLKRIIVPEFIDFTGLEIFKNNKDIAKKLKEFLQKRTEKLRQEMLKSNMFLSFLNSAESKKTYQEVLAELNNGQITRSRYFRDQTESFKRLCAEELKINYQCLNAEIQINSLRLDPAMQQAINKLRDFCRQQHNRLSEKIFKNIFFNKGLHDKRDLFANLINDINQTDFNDTPEANRKSLIINFLKQAAIISHHHRYSKCDRLFGPKDSQSWQEFKKFFSEETNEYTNLARNMFIEKKARAIEIKQDHNTLRVDNYNDYRLYHKSKPIIKPLLTTDLEQKEKTLEFD